MWMLGSKQHPFVRKGYIAKTRVNSVFILTKVMITEQVTWKGRLLASEKTPILQFLVPRHALHTCPRSPCSPASRAVRHSSHCIPTAPVLVPYERAGVSAVNLRDSNRTFFPVKKQQRASSLSKMIIELPMFTFSRAGGGRSYFVSICLIYKRFRTSVCLVMRATAVVRVVRLVDLVSLLSSAYAC